MLSDLNLTPTSTNFDIIQGGLSIPGRSWGSPTDCKAVALLIHGLGAHSAWFEALARQLKIRRFYAVSYDQIGFGKRRQEKLTSYTQWIDDMIRVYDYLREREPNKPIYLMGNSMGGLLSLVAAEFMAPSGLILFSPGFDGYPQTFTQYYRITTVIKALLWPDLEVALPYGCDIVTRDEPTRAFIENDPERRFCVPAGMLLELLKLSNKVLKHHKQINCPVLMLTAGKDRIVNNVANTKFFERLTAPGKKAYQFEEAWHDLMFDPLIDEVADEIVRWIEAGSAQGVSAK